MAAPPVQALADDCGQIIVRPGDYERDFQSSADYQTIVASKTWDDFNDADGTRPDSVTVDLYIDGEYSQSLVLSEKNNWTAPFEEVENYSTVNGIKKGHTYEVREQTPDGYRSEVSDAQYSDSYTTDANGKTHETTTYAITNHLTHVYILAHKNWMDADDWDNIRPNSIDYQVKNRQTGETVDSKTVTAADNWSYEFLEPRYDEDGNEIVYEVTDQYANSDDFYSSYGVILGTQENGWTVGNLHVTTGSLTVTKKWADGQSSHDPITVKLSSNNGYLTYTDNEGVDRYLSYDKATDENSELPATVTLSDANDWTCTFENLPLVWYFPDETYGNVTYSVSEIDTPDGYHAVVSDMARVGTTDTMTATITNISDETADIPVSKQWADNGDECGNRPDSVTVHLLADGADTGKAVTLDSSNDWASAFTGMRVYDAADGHKISYTVSEDAVAGYTSAATGDAASGFTIENSTQTVSIPVSKVWSGGTGFWVKVHLLEDGADNGRAMTLTAAKGWTGSFDGLPAYRNGQKVKYTVAEDVVDGYVPTVALNDAGNGFTITNTKSGTPVVPVTPDEDDEQVTVSVAKVWYGGTGDSTVHLYRDGVDTGLSIQLSGDQATVFPKQARYAPDGQEYTYTVVEDPVDGFSSTVSGSLATGFIIRNVSTATTDVKVAKAWDDGNDARGVRPDSVTVHLWADGTDTGKELTLDSSNDWASAFSGLPVYDAADGHKVAYTVSEDAVAGYTSAITGDAASGFTITNTVKPGTGGKTEVNVNVNVSVSGGSGNGSGNGSGGAASTASTGTPATGDTVALGICIAVVVAAGAVVAIAAYRRRKGDQGK